MRMYTIQCFRRATYHTCVFNIACAGACECERTPFLTRLASHRYFRFLFSKFQASKCSLFSFIFLPIDLFPDSAAMFVYVFPKCIVRWSGVKSFATCWGKCLRLVNVGVFEGCNILFQLFYNVFHRRRITKMESWRSSKVPSSIRCSNWQQCS